MLVPVLQIISLQTERGAWFCALVMHQQTTHASNSALCNIIITLRYALQIVIHLMQPTQIN